MLEQALQGAKQFPSSEEGLYQAINAVGGAPMINKISGILDRNKMAKIAINGLLSGSGLSVDGIVNKFNSEGKAIQGSNISNRKGSYNVNSLRERLDKMG